MKRILAMLLALTMTLAMLGSFTGCGIVRLLLKEKKTELVADNEEIDGLLGLLPDDNEKLVGTWKADVDFTGYVKEGFERSEAGEMAGYFTFSELTIGIVLEFTDEGTFRMWIDPDSIDDLSEKMKTQMEAGLTLYFEDTIREQGLDMTVEELLQASETSMDELLSELDFEPVGGSIPEEVASGKYDSQD